MSVLIKKIQLGVLRKWTWVISTHSVVGFISILVVLIYIFVPSGEADCVEQGRITSHNGRNDEIEVVDKICEGFARPDATFVNIIPVRLEHKSLVFSYLPNGEEPNISWITDDLIVIDIPESLHIYRKVEKIGTIDINYIFVNPKK
jgi:hypothetical protein